MADEGKSQWRIVFLGPPNSGKGTQATLLAKWLTVPTISTGELLRSAVRSGTELGRRVEEVMARGELVDDELMSDIVSDRLSQPDVRNGFILDGYPRTPEQAETLASILKQTGSELNAVILVNANDAALVERGLNRGRADDREEIIRERLRIYYERTAPLIEFYDNLGILSTIDGDQPIEAISLQILQVVGIDRA